MRAPASTASSDLPPADKTAHAALLAAIPKSHVETTTGRSGASEGAVPAEFALLLRASSGVLKPSAAKTNRRVAIAWTLIEWREMERAYVRRFYRIVTALAGPKG